jgi:hypothetical protein
MPTITAHLPLARLLREGASAIVEVGVADLTAPLGMAQEAR